MKVYSRYHHSAAALPEFTGLYPVSLYSALSGLRVSWLRHFTLLRSNKGLHPLLEYSALSGLGASWSLHLTGQHPVSRYCLRLYAMSAAFTLSGLYYIAALPVWSYIYNKKIWDNHW